MTPRAADGYPTLQPTSATIRVRGAASISQGRTPHEVRDELCRVMGL